CDLVCAVDLGGTNLRAANIDRDGRIYVRVRTATPETVKAEDIVSAIVAAVRECETEGLNRGAQIQAISVVVPGSVHAETRVVVNAPNIPSLPGFRLASALREALDRPVLLENDANAAALGEMWQGAARNCKTIICLTLGTGVGGAIILDGKLWRGVDGTAGEIGHASVDPFGEVKCKCGNVGCLEVYASATAIVRMTRDKIAKHPGSALHSINADELTSENICGAAIEGDEFAIEVFRSMGVYLGVAMADVVNIFNPEMIVIGGGVSAAWDLFAQHAREEVIKRAFPVPAQRCQIVGAECGDDGGLLGAAWLAFPKGEGVRV
ncbi:MAG TPA: ROK family protein, partial [Pyrinomonadaceae bacterium]|nr:ROK family protein [Pyrinomonadaceae bacterium]